MDFLKEKQPWLAASLSGLLPGLGQAYSGCWFRAIIFFVMYLVFCYCFLFTSSESSIYLFPFFALSIIFFPFIAGLDIAFHIKKCQKSQSESIETAQKDPWLAVFLSLIWPGLGHAYLRKWIMFLFLAIVNLCLFVAVKNTLIIIISKIIFKIIVCAHILFMANSVDKIKHKVIVTFLISACLLLAIKTTPFYYMGNFITLKKVTGNSMEPTLIDGDKALINKRAYRYKEPVVGDIIAIRPEDYVIWGNQIEKRGWLVKRIIATGGDIVRFKNDGLYVNDRLYKPYDKEYFDNLINYNLIYAIEFAKNRIYEVPKGSFYVVGDNFEYSHDSRYFGAIPRNAIYGKVILKKPKGKLQLIAISNDAR